MIAFLISEIDIRGGTHKQLLELLDYADKRQVEFKVITQRLDYTKSYPGFSRYADRIIEMGAITWKNKWSQARKLRRLIADADTVNVHDNEFELVFMAFVGKHVVWQVNDLPHRFKEGVNKMTRFHPQNPLKLAWLYLSIWLFIDQITVNVTKNAERIKRRLHMNAKVLYCGITPVGISHNNQRTFDRFNNRKIRLLSSGVFIPYRNYETLVKAVGLLREKGLDVTLNIFGSYELRPEYYYKITTMINNAGLSDSIRILGQIDEDRYRELHAESDAFCFVNIDQSWGLAVFEAMSAGLPVIVSNSVGATEILHDGQDALFVNPKAADEIVNHVVALMTDRSKYLDIQANGCELVRKYSWENAYCKPMLEILLNQDDR